MGGFNKFQGHKVNERQILNFYKPFIYKNFVMDPRISRFGGFAGWICSLDVIKVTGTYLMGKGQILDSSWELSL